MKMMSYRYDKQKKNQTRWYIIGTVLLVLALFTPIYSWIFDSIEQPLAQVWQNQDKTITGNESFFQALYNRQQILVENKKLQNEVKRLEVDNLRTRYLSDELEKIYQMNEQDSMLTSARVLQQGSLGSQDTLLINKGSTTGVSMNDYIVSNNNVLIGFVSDVYDTTARVMLYSNTEQVIDGVLFPYDVNLSAHGYGKGAFSIETPREIEVTKGDIFYSLEQPGRIIAIVREVVFDPRDPFKKVYLSYPMNVNQIQTVGIKKAPTLTNVK